MILRICCAVSTAMAVREGWKNSGLLKGLGIPAPTGQYTVGCVDLMQKLERDNDGLLVRLFYPTTPQIQEGAGYEYAKWTPHKRYTRGFLDFYQVKLPGLLSTLTNLLIDPRMPAFDGAPLFHNAKATATCTTPPNSETEQATATDLNQEEQPSPREIQFPVIVSSHGLGTTRTVYSAICIDLASHGYVVAAVEHRDRSAAITLKRVPVPGGKDGELMDEWLEFYHRPESEPEFPLRNDQVKQRAFEVKQSLSLLHLLNDGGEIRNMLEGGTTFDYGQFKGRLDVATAAVMGHSFGGATTVQTLSEDSRFLCGIGLDTWMYPIHRDILNIQGIQQPLLFINSFDFQWKDNVQRMMKLTRAPDEQGISQSSILTLKDTNHYNQSDALFVLPIRGKMMSRLPPYLAHQINQRLCIAFFRRYLLKDPAYQQRIPDLDGGEGCSEYIIHGTNVDISDPPTEAEQQEGEEGEQIEGGDASKKDTIEEEEEEGKTEDGTVEGEKEKEGDDEVNDSTGQQPKEVASEQEKSEEDAAALDVDSSNAGQPKL